MTLGFIDSDIEFHSYLMSPFSSTDEELLSCQLCCESTEQTASATAATSSLLSGAKPNVGVKVCCTVEIDRIPSPRILYPGVTDQQWHNGSDYEPPPVRPDVTAAG